MAKRERPDYKKIHALEYELGFREDPPPEDIMIGVGVPIRISGAVGLWQIPPPRMTREERRERVEQLRQRYGVPRNG